MSRYKNGQVPDHALILLADGTNQDGYWQHLLPAGTLRKHLALVEIGRQRHGRALTITSGWNGYRPLAPQRVARANACARGRCGDAATPGTSSHGGEYEGADVFAMDYSNWGAVFGTRELFYAACREVGLEPGVFSWEPWHVIDRDPWAPAPAGTEQEGPFMALTGQQQNDLVDRVEATAQTVARLERLVTELFVRVRGEDPDVDMMQDILGQLTEVRKAHE